MHEIKEKQKNITYKSTVKYIVVAWFYQFVFEVLNFTKQQTAKTYYISIEVMEALAVYFTDSILTFTYFYTLQ